MLRWIALLGVILAFGCGDPTGPRPDLSGDWLGTYVDNATTNSVRWILVDLNPSVTGTADVVLADLNILFDYTATGSHQAPNVSLTMTSTILATERYEGTTQGPDSIIGILTDGGGGAHSLTMVRQ